jgi:hypothetical protein
MTGDAKAIVSVEVKLITGDAKANSSDDMTIEEGRLFQRTLPSGT